VNKIGVRRHLLIMIPTLNAGGAERVIVTLLKYLDREKFRISLAVIDTEKAAFLGDVPKDIQVFNLRTKRVRNSLPKMLRLIWNLRPDVLLSTLPDLNIALSFARPLLPPMTRYVARETIVLSEHLRTNPNKKLRSWAYRTLYRRFDSIICQSADMREDLSANFSIPTQKLAVVNNPVDIDRIKELAAHPVENHFGTTKDTLNIVAVGRLDWQKGFDLLIEAIAMSGLKQLRALVLGEGPLRESLEQEARSKGVDEQIRFIGLQKNPYAYMARADAFVLCSRFEGFPNVMLEALASGAHVIATPAPGGVIEIANSTGRVQIASSVSAEALSTELKRFAERGPDPGPANLERFRAGEITKEYERILLGNV